MSSARETRRASLGTYNLPRLPVHPKGNPRKRKKRMQSNISISVSTFLCMITGLVVVSVWVTAR